MYMDILYKSEHIWFKIRQKFLQGRIIRNSHVDSTATIQSGCQFINSSIGRHSYAAYDCLIINCSIGSFCSIAPGVVIGAAQHPLNRVSTSPAFENVANSSPKARFANFPVPECKRTIIDSDVWIGQNAIIKDGVKIGIGAVIGSGAVVTKDIEPYAIVGGCPAQIIRYRFCHEIILGLMKSEWWLMPDDKLKCFAKYFDSPEKFISAINDCR